MKGYIVSTLLPKTAHVINLVICTILSPHIRRAVSEAAYRPCSESPNIHKERLSAYYDAFIHP
jgi:hypothetical protein